jgi:dTDP-4-amino-4,6-dideoxygalactose transaminase
MHPFAAAVGRLQLRQLDEINGVANRSIRSLNDRLIQLAGLSEPRLRPDQKRVYYYMNMLLLNEKKAGFSRDALLKALKAEGVKATMWDYPEQHKLKIYSEARWWHHAPAIPASMPGNERVNKTHIFLPIPYGEAPELLDQWVKAFEKIWAHRDELARQS